MVEKVQTIVTIIVGVLVLLMFYNTGNNLRNNGSSSSTPNHFHSSQNNPKLRKLEGNPSLDRGIAMCVGSKMISDALAVLDQIRNVHNSSLPVAIIHCNELPLEASTTFHKSFDNINIIDICEHGSIFGLHHNDMLKRLRSWFCKSAAIVLAPFDEVMIIDLDTIWFDKPDVYFNYPGYKAAGALYVRDRMTYDKGRGFQNAIETFIHDMNPNITITSEYAKSRETKDGINLFWRGSADGNSPTYNNFQDSSMVLINRKTHPRLLSIIAQLIPTFSLGWGDKEMYWISSIISQEPYVFEPFLFTLYGPCGLIMHYNPNDYHRAETARALYINGEWLLEKFHTVGHDLEFTMPNAILAASNTTLDDISHRHGCACPIFGCRPMTSTMNQHVLRAQWERKSRVLSRAALQDLHIPKSLEPLPNRPLSLSYTIYDSNSNKTQTWYIDMSNDEFLDYQNVILQSIPCVPIWFPLLDDISLLNQWMIRRGDCGRLGCAYAPIVKHPQFQAQEYCIPVSFNPNGPEPELAHYTLFTQISPPLRNIADGSVIRGTASRSVYLVRNKTLCEFPNGDTFLKMGFEWGQIRMIHQREVDYWPKGPQLPPL